MKKKYFLFLCFFINICIGQVENQNKVKSPKKAFYFSLIPGLGQAYNEKWIKSFVIIGLEIIAYESWRNNMHKYKKYNDNDYPLDKHRYLEKRNKYAWWLGFIYLYGILDAIVDAHLFEFNKLMEETIVEKKNEE